MENQPDFNSSETTPINPIQLNQSPVPIQAKTSLVVPILLTVLVSAVIFGFSGYFFGKQASLNKDLSALNQDQPSVSPSVAPSIQPSEISPASDSVNNWKTYINEKFGFSIKYPLYAKTESRDPDPFPVAIQIDNLKPRVGGGGGPEVVGWLVIVSEPQKNLEKLSLRDWANSKKLSVVDLNLYSQTKIDIMDTIVDNHKAITWKFPESYQYYLIEKNSTEVMFIMINKGDTTQVSDSLFSQIISTIQFTD